MAAEDGIWARPLLAFFALTYSISWVIWVPLAASSQGLLPFELPHSITHIAGFGPSLSALILTALMSGRRGLRGVIGKVFVWRVGPFWYLVSLLGPPSIGIAAIAISRWLRGSASSLMGFEQLSTVVPVFLVVLLFGGPLGEEIGWRGYALPLLQARFRPFSASLMLGIVWWLWHLPLFWIEGSAQAGLPMFWFMAQITGTSILYTWLYNRTGGSLLISMLFHAAGNTAAGFLPFLPTEQTGGEGRSFVVFIILLWAVAVAVTILDKSPPSDQQFPPY